MARNPSGKEVMERAQKDLISATTADQLRTVQAVLIPLELGLSLRDTAQVIGKNPGWVARARLDYINGSSGRKSSSRRGGRRNNLLSLADEKKWVERVREKRYPWQSAAVFLHEVLERVLARPVSVSTAYRMIQRVDAAAAKEKIEKVHQII